MNSILHFVAVFFFVCPTRFSFLLSFYSFCSKFRFLFVECCCSPLPRPSSGTRIFHPREFENVVLLCFFPIYVPVIQALYACVELFSAGDSASWRYSSCFGGFPDFVFLKGFPFRCRFFFLLLPFVALSVFFED